MKVVEHSFALLGICIVLLLLYMTYQEICKSMKSPFADYEMINITSESRSAANTENTLHQQFLRKERKALEVLARMAVVYIVTYLPMGVTLIVWNSNHFRSRRSYGLPYKIVMEVSELVYVLSAMVNTFITLLMKSGFKDVIARRFSVIRNSISIRSRSTLITT